MYIEDLKASELVRSVILSFCDNVFSLQDVVIVSEIVSKHYGILITNKKIKSVVDALCDNGMLNISILHDGTIAFANTKENLEYNGRN